LNVELPRGIKTPTALKRSRLYTIIPILGVIVAVGLTVVIFIYASSAVEQLRNIALLGSLGPGIPIATFVFQLLLVGTCVISLQRMRNRKQAVEKAGKYTPSVGIVIAAYNESAGIIECIKSLDEASLRYKGTCYLYLVDNNSEDNTSEAGKTALTQCQKLKGEVLFCKKPGKAIALNMGVHQVKEEIIIRLDADTVCSPGAISSVVPYFADSSVGLVGVLPLPKRKKSFFGRMRTVEIIMKILFARMAQQASDAIVVIPGRFAAFRKKALEQAGDFAAGMNGEDTDMSIRIGRLGYRIINDPKVTVFSDDPADISDIPVLREQRIRWSRAGIHSSVRNLTAFTMGQGLRGIWYVPMSILSIFRRSFTLLLIIFGVLALALSPALLVLRDGATLGAIVAGPAFLIILGVLLANRQFSLLLYLPLYLLFVLMRIYFAIESLFTLRPKMRGIKKL
jgi:cellulose synthase/poly-beta-1,6-N-acetylglucosamine synthase-like glycosyltransferase